MMNASPDPAANLPNNASRDPLMVRLYIVGGALNSLRALMNLKAICEEYFPKHYQIEVIDIFEDPLRALTDKVLVTPTLVKTSPPPSIRLAGDLSQKQTVLLVLQSTTRK